MRRLDRYHTYAGIGGRRPLAIGVGREDRRVATKRTPNGTGEAKTSYNNVTVAIYYHGSRAATTPTPSSARSAALSRLQGAHRDFVTPAASLAW